MHRYARLAMVVGLVLVLAMSGGCKKKNKAINPELGAQTATQTPSETTGGLPQIPIEQLNFQPAADLAPVYFDYDQFTLRPDAVKTLNEDAQKMKAEAPNTYWRIEGNCDERGTQEYNLALGEKRALAVREYLIKVGVPGDRMITISYGEEKPAKEGHDESAWKWNRRCEFSRATR